MIGVMEILVLPLFNSWSRKMLSVSLFILLCPTLSHFLSWDGLLLRCLANFDCSSSQQQL